MWFLKIKYIRGLSKKMKRSKKEDEVDESSSYFSLKWKTTRVYPNSDFTNGMEWTETRKYPLDSFDDFIDAEIKIQKRIFEQMGCDEEKTKKALLAIRYAYESCLDKK